MTLKKNNIQAINAWCADYGYPIKRLVKSGILPVSYATMIFHNRAGNENAMPSEAVNQKAGEVLKMLKPVLLHQSKERRLAAVDAAILRYKRRSRAGQ